jgi:hypothetical protein
MNESSDLLATVSDIETDVTHESVAAIALLNRSEVEAQLDAAHKYPRKVSLFLKEAMALATITREVAESCIYSLPRGGKMVTGPSVRLAEIAASAYRNLHVAARVVDAEDKEVVSQGVTWDLERNVRVTVEARRRITKKDGSRFDDDMITVTGNAAASIALRNAIFRVIPRAYIDVVYAEARRVAVGDARTLADRRLAVLANFEKLGVVKERVLAKVGKTAVEDVGLDELEVLIGLGTAIRNKDMTIDDVFSEGTTKSTVPSDLEEKLSKSVAAAKKGKKSEKAEPATNEKAKAEEKPPTATKDERPVCIVCRKPIDGEAKATWDTDGAEAFRHLGCNNITGEREPGQEG